MRKVLAIINLVYDRIRIIAIPYAIIVLILFMGGIPYDNLFIIISSIVLAIIFLIDLIKEIVALIRTLISTISDGDTPLIILAIISAVVEVVDILLAILAGFVLNLAVSGIFVPCMFITYLILDFITSFPLDFLGIIFADEDDD